MASQINASNSGFGGIVSTGDSSGVLQLQTASTTAVTIDASQNVGIGTTSPNGKFESYANSGYSVIANSSAGSVAINPSSNAIVFGTTNVAAYATGNYDAATHVYKTSGTERMRINSSGIVTMPYQPAFFVIANGAYTVGNDIVYNEVSVNIGSHYNSSSGRFTAPVTGVYYFSMKNIQTNTASVIRFYFVKNGTVLGAGSLLDGAWQSRFENTPGNYREQQTSSIIQMNAGDYLTVRQVAGTASIDSSGYSTFLGHLIG